MDEYQLVFYWRFRANRIQQAHYLAGRRYERFHRYLGAPTVIIMAIVGTTIFSNLAENASQLSLKWQIVIGLLSISAAALSGLQTFLGFAELGEKHRVAGARYANLKQRLELLDCYEGEDLKAKLEGIEKEWSKLREDCPNLPQTVWKRVKKEFTYEKYCEKYRWEPFDNKN